MNVLYIYIYIHTYTYIGVSPLPMRDSPSQGLGGCPRLRAQVFFSGLFRLCCYCFCVSVMCVYFVFVLCCYVLFKFSV